MKINKTLINIVEKLNVGIDGVFIRKIFAYAMRSPEHYKAYREIELIVMENTVNLGRLVNPVAHTMRIKDSLEKAIDSTEIGEKYDPYSLRYNFDRHLSDSFCSGGKMQCVNTFGAVREDPILRSHFSYHGDPFHG